jgi:twinkle protein
MSSERNFYDLDEIKRALHGRIDEFVLELFPDAKRQASCYKIGGISGEKGGSMMISTRADNAGYYKDFANPNCSGPAWHLVAEKKNLTVREAIEWLAKYLHIKPVQTFGGGVTRATNPEKIKQYLRPLQADVIKYAASRGIGEETLRAYNVSNHSSGGAAFTYEDCYENIGMVKKWGIIPGPDGKKDTWVSADPVMCLFGKPVCDPDKRIQRLVITEGEWDAMSCYQVGIPAVSIPMGASNTKWIEEDYHFLSHFDDIVLLFDNDQAGKDAAKIAQDRLGKERCLCVFLPLKDANDMLRSGRGEEIRQAIESAEREPIAEIVDPGGMRDGVRAFMRGDHLVSGDPFFLPDFDLQFRPHEWTLWYGYSFHGKSQCVQNQIACNAAKGKMACVASFEQPPELTFSQILLNYTAYPNLPHTDEFDKAYDHLSQLVFMYRSMDRADPVHLINTFTHAHKRYGIDTFVVDNVMTLDIDRGDNTQQAKAADLMRVFVSKYPVHLHIVAHPRKPPENTKTPPSMADIRGAGEWGDMPHNVVTVWRNMEKSEHVAESENLQMDREEIMNYEKTVPCGKILVRKQRTTGDTPMTRFWFHKETKRFMAQWGEPRPMFSECPWR